MCSVLMVSKKEDQCRKCVILYDEYFGIKGAQIPNKPSVVERVEGILGASLDGFWRVLAAYCDRLGNVSGHLGSVVGCLGGVLARLGRVLGASWARLGRVLSAVGGFVGASKSV